jgi:hypothetical protein
MATRSRIAIEDEKGTVRSVYSHWDGYPSHNGRILFEHFQNPEKVNNLIALGDLSSLAPEIELAEGHTFENPVKGVTVFYGRDRGEDRTEAKTHLDRNSFLRSDVEEYGYLFTNEGKWLMVDGHKNSSTRDFIELEEVLKTSE